MYFLLLALIGVSVHADELVLTRGQLLKEGFKPLPKAIRLPAPQPRFGEHSLPWPVTFEDERHIIGNVMTQFQDYGGGAYYHGGDDLRVRRREWVYAPISGRLEAGHYGYEMHSDGSHTKFWKAWPKTGNSMYFEVAVIDEQGYRFELHHIDRSTLTGEIVTMLNAGGGVVKAGQKLGQVVDWPNSDTDNTLYHHCHYNIIAPNDIGLNPEHYSHSLKDDVPPVINAVYATTGEIVVDAYDQLGQNIYKHTPAAAKLVFDSGEQTVWDFRQSLSNAAGSFPPIWEFFRESLRLPDGRTITTDGNYSQRRFLLRLPVPNGAKGKYRIEISDAAGNVSTRAGDIVN